MFNLLHTTEGDKANFWILTNEPFDQLRFASKVWGKDVRAFNENINAWKCHTYENYDGQNYQAEVKNNFIDALRVYEVQYRNLDLN